jgi:hypothetical protein
MSAESRVALVVTHGSRSRLCGATVVHCGGEVTHVEADEPDLVPEGAVVGVIDVADGSTLLTVVTGRPGPSVLVLSSVAPLR